MVQGLRTILAALMMGWLGAAAWAQETTMNAEVAVDATGADATEAKANALAKGEQEAFRKLVQEFMAGQDAPAYDPAKVPLLIDSFEVRDEKIAANRYRATVTYLFNLERVTGFLAGAAVEAPQQDPAVAAGAMNKILVLAPIRSLKDWQDIKGRMERSGAVRSLRVMAFSLNQVDAEVGLPGDPNRLAQALKPHGLVLEREGEYWVVRRP